MTYIHTTQYKEKFQKDLYIKKKLEIGHNNTPWAPKVNITLKKIVCELKDTASGSGSSILRIHKNYGHSSQQIIFDAVFAENDVTQETSSIFSFSVSAGDEITFEVASVTSNDPGGEVIISFVYENT
jgi:hypothetical protein